MSTSALRVSFLCPSTPILNLLKDLNRLVPSGDDFSSDQWDVRPWALKETQLHQVLPLGKYNNGQLKILVKLYILHNRMTKRISSGTAYSYANVLLLLDEALGGKDILKINNGDFIKTEAIILKRHSKSNIHTAARFVEGFANWLNHAFGLRISYKKSFNPEPSHGRFTGDDQKRDKLMPFEVLAELISARHKDNLLPIDSFCLNIAVIFIATGFRINELLTMPKECILEEGGALGLLFFPEKSGTPVPRWIMPSMADVVKTCILDIKKITEKGRSLARNIHENGRSDLNWRDILTDQKASRYFIDKYCHDWTNKSENRLFENKGVWVQKYKQYIDLKGLLVKCHNNKNELSRLLNTMGTPLNRQTINIKIAVQEYYEKGELHPILGWNAQEIEPRNSWDTDSRVISVTSFARSLGRVRLKKVREYVKANIAIARDKYQLKGKVYPLPPRDVELEDKYKYVYYPVLRDREGKALLYPHEALFVIEKGYFVGLDSNKRGADFSLFSDGMLQRWLSGDRKIDIGTKNSHDSCWSRLGIIDPKTGETARYSSHDFRHWLNTQMNQGGMSDDQIALMFNRKYKAHNAVYDQRSTASTLKGLQDSIRKGDVLGGIASNYSKLAEDDLETAERYLTASTMTANILPHGLCSNTWANTPCPHQLSCMTSSDKDGKNEGPCELLFIDPNNEKVIQELKRLTNNAKIAISKISKDSPQYMHYSKVYKNGRKLLSEAQGGRKVKRGKMPKAGLWKK